MNTGVDAKYFLETFRLK